jgi:ligand-binding sensor domain-containing protein
MYDVSGQVFPKFEFMQSNCSNDLPSESIGSIIKDKEGFIWLASWDGLCRYDGKNLVVFKNDPLNANTIAENKVGFLVEDNESNIWVSHLKGISCYIKKEGKFKNYKTYINVKGDTLNIEYGFMRKDASGNIYCTEMGGIYNKVFDKKKNTFRLLNIDTTNDGHNNKNASNKMVGVLSDIQWDGSMYLQSSNGTFLYNPKTNIRKRVCNSSTYTPLTIFKDYKKQLWLAEWNAGLSIINEQTKEKQLIIPNNRIHHLLQYKDANGMYWLLASDLQSGNIFIINPITKAYTSQVFKLENAITANATPANLYQDVEGKLYVTSQMGLVEATHTKQYINTTYTYDRGKPADLFYKNLVRSGTQQPNGNYIVGLVWHNGLRIYDSNLVLKKTITNYLYNEKNYDLDVRNFTNLGNDKFLMSGFTGFAFLDKYKITPIKYVPKKDEAKDTLVIFVRETLPINENEYWVRILRKGVYIFNTKTAQFGKQYLFADKAKKIPFKDIITIAYDDTKQLWVLDVDHLYKYNRNTDNFDTIPVNQNNKYLSAFNHMHIAYGNIWITGNGGLLRYNIETQKQTFYAPSSGLPNDVTYKAVSYNEETICILLEVGVSILNTTTGKIINFNAKNGLSTSDMEFDAAFFIDHSKNLIVGNNGILTKIDVPHLLKLKTAMPTIAITEVKGNDSTISIFINNKNEKQTYLDFKNFPVNINFSIIDFSPKGDRKYFYRYTGKDTTWIPCTDGVIPINTIEPGDYTLQVTGSVNGVYADKIEQITFTILPRWHQSWWFKLLAGILLFTGISSLYKWRINTAKASQKQQTEIQRLAAQEYKNQLELAQISNYFSTSLINLETEEEVLWDVAKNLIGKLGFEDCIIYLWNKDKTKLVQRAGYGPKGSIEEINKQPLM